MEATAETLPLCNVDGADEGCLLSFIRERTRSFDNSLDVEDSTPSLVLELTATTVVAVFPSKIESGDGNGVTKAGVSATTSATTTGEVPLFEEDDELRNGGRDNGTATTTGGDTLGDTSTPEVASNTGVTTVVVLDSDNTLVFVCSTSALTTTLESAVGSVTRRTNDGREGLREFSPWLALAARRALSATCLECALLGSLLDRDSLLLRGGLCGTALSLSDLSLLSISASGGESTNISEADADSSEVAFKHTGSEASTGRVTDDIAEVEDSEPEDTVFSTDG